MVDGIVIFPNRFAAWGWNVVLILSQELVHVGMIVMCDATSSVGNSSDGRGRHITLSLHCRS